MIDKHTYDAVRIADAATTFAALATMYPKETLARARAHLVDQRERSKDEADVHEFYSAAIALIDRQEA